MTIAAPAAAYGAGQQGPRGLPSYNQQAYDPLQQQTESAAEKSSRRKGIWMIALVIAFIGIAGIVLIILGEKGIGPGSGQGHGAAPAEKNSRTTMNGTAPAGQNSSTAM